jgi:transcriptional regulator with XRE-family HTH domain
MKRKAKAKAKNNGFDKEALLAWRDRMGYSQKQAADALGCSRCSLSYWENGKHKVPRYIGLACAALALGMTGYGDNRHEDDKDE